VTGFYKRDGMCLLRGASHFFKCSSGGAVCRKGWCWWLFEISCYGSITFWYPTHNEL